MGARRDLQIYINRESPVSLPDQLSAQLGHMIAAGALAPGDRLPSIRALASKLGIHHNTVRAAYQALQARGLLVLLQGSGAKVAVFDAERDAWLASFSLRAMAEQFVAQARALGHGDDSILAACQAALAPSAIARVILVNPHEDLQALYLHELGEWLDLPLRGMTVEEVGEEDAAMRATSCFVTSTNHAPRLQAMLGSQTPVISHLSSLEPLLNRVRELPADALIAIASFSPRFRFLIKEMLSAICDESQLIDLPLEDEERLRAADRLSSLIVTDALSAVTLAPQCRSPLFSFRLLGGDLREELAKQLPVQVIRPIV